MMKSFEIEFVIKKKIVSSHSNFLYTVTLTFPQYNTILITFVVIELCALAPRSV